MEEVVSIKKYIGFEKGKAPKETFDFLADGLVPYLSPEYLRGTGNPLYVKPSNKLASIDDGELIILWDGSNAGEVFISKKGVLGSTMTKIVFDENEFDKSYFSYALKYNEYFLKAKTAGSGIPHVDKGIVKMIEVFKPKPAEQLTIASILSKVDLAITATKNSKAKAERLKKSLMQNLLTGKLKPDGTWRKENEFYKDEKFGNVPIGWKVEKLKKVFKLKNGKGNPTTNLKSKPEGDFNIPVFGGNGITGYFDTPFLSHKTLIIGRVGEYCGSVYKTPEKCWVTDNALWISELFEKDFDFDFWFFALTYKKLNHYGDATGQPKITQSGIGNLKVTFPENEIEQKQIASKIIDIEIVINSKQYKIKKLERLKKALMQNLLTGKVRVKVSNELTK